MTLEPLRTGVPVSRLLTNGGNDRREVNGCEFMW